MKIKYLGTAAAEGIPSPYCTCENCRKAWERRGKDIRSRSQAVIDGKILIDLPCDTFYHAAINKVCLTDIRHCLITHVHSDHFYPAELTVMKKGFAHVPEDFPPFNIYGSSDVAVQAAGELRIAGERVAFHEIAEYEPFDIDGYTVTALKAYHGTQNPYIYIIENNGKAMLYAHDTDIFKDETWEYLNRRGIKFDYVSLDCTEGAYEELRYHGHMCLGRNRSCRRMMTEYGLADSGTVFCLNHFSHNGLNVTYDEFSAIAAKEGFKVSFDGMEYEF